MKKTILYACMGLMALLMAGCDGSKYEIGNLFPEQYHKVIGLKTSDEKLQIVSKADRVPVVETVTVYKTGSITAYTAKARLNILSQEEMEDRVEQAVSSNYRVLPNDTYRMDGNPEMNFGLTEMYKSVDIVFNLEKIYDLPDTTADGERIAYILYIELESESDALIYEAKKSMVWLFEKSTLD